ncbi:MAG TPA: helicase-related protein [Chthoniobacteraceae bacterium]|jgi:RecG-like helicase/REP element-mobilizing transposase RayT|nr:helicase-related protein [Chthoniobacteraceae bacterium]
MELETPLNALEWLPAARVRQLERLGLLTVEALLTHFPKRYEDRTRFDRFPTGETAQPVCVCGVVKKTSVRRIRGGQKMFDVLLEEEQSHALSQPLLCRWFNAHWVEKMIVNGHRVVVYGRPKRSGAHVVIAHPEFEIVEDDAEISIHLNRIAPVHGASEGLSPRVLRRIIWDVLLQLGEVQASIPSSLDPTPRAWALRQIHFPESFAALERARRHLVLTEFFAMQMCVGAKRAEQAALPGEAHCVSDELMRGLHAALPFPLTGAQQRTIAEIRTDLSSARPMNRLLHGDVGSGKTLVALSAMLLVVEAGFQAALMAPTQILAEQHYLNFVRLCEPLGLRVALRTGARRESSEALPLFAQAERGVASGSTGRRPVASGGRPDAPGVEHPPAAPDTAATSDTSYSRRRVPHFERPWAKYMVTFSTRNRRSLSPSARQIVLDCILHWKDRRYTLYAACVMSDHVHLLFEPSVKEVSAESGAVFFSLTEIFHTVKSFTAHEINCLENREGALWEAEWLDRMIRSESDLQEKFSYIVRNPWAEGGVREGEDYPWVWYGERDSEKTGAGSRLDFPAGRREGQASGLRSPDAITLLPDSEPHLVIGTHALLYEGAGLAHLGLAVIDEQHKFGVLQRARLRAQGSAPDVLVMTATPIPRTMTMTLYGDLDVSTLDELPKNRGKIVTAVRPAEKMPEAAKFIREHLEAGRQAYIVYPLIDESEKLESKAAAAEFTKWQSLLAPLRCELLHGRIPPEEKDAIMERFRRGETSALIATTVIEVGIDVPNANMMLIENSERFGLAQLHQLRGRIGRGEHKSYCILLHAPKADEGALEKLRILEETSDGFEIAEADLKLRGPGDILGTAQSGLPPLKLGNLLTDRELMQLARNAAFLIFERDPQLQQPEHQRYRAVLAEGRKLMLSQVS